MKLRKKIEKAILRVSPSLEGTKLCNELVESIKKSIEEDINEETEATYERGRYRGRNPIEYSEHR